MKKIFVILIMCLIPFVTFNFNNIAANDGNNTNDVYISNSNSANAVFDHKLYADNNNLIFVGMDMVEWKPTDKKIQYTYMYKSKKLGDVSTFASKKIKHTKGTQTEIKFTVQHASVEESSYKFGAKFDVTAKVKFSFAAGLILENASSASEGVGPLYLFKANDETAYIEFNYEYNEVKYTMVTVTFTREIDYNKRKTNIEGYYNYRMSISNVDKFDMYDYDNSRISTTLTYGE